MTPKLNTCATAAARNAHPANRQRARSAFDTRPIPRLSPRVCCASHAFWRTPVTISDGVYGASQRISREEALRLATVNNAKLTFEESLKGSIERGKLADLVILSADYMTVPEKQIESLKPMATMVGGRFVYTDPAAGL